MTERALSEEQVVHLVRNALLVAGQEMGDGDQWPVVKDTIYKIMQDFEELKVERNVNAELKVHLYEQLKIMEAGLSELSNEKRELYAPKVKEWRELCDAYFTDVDPNAVEYDEDNEPDHIKRMRVIIKTLEDDNG